jgi:hypothetical protein
MSNGEIQIGSTLAGLDISNGAQIYPIKGGDTVLEPDEARINPVGQIYPT